MNPDRWKRIEEVFHQALELSGVERSEYLERMCQEDPQLRGEVDSLLAEAESGQDLSSVVGAVAGELALAKNDPLIGAAIGPYRVTGLIGYGGMGDVYRAQDTRLHRELALKVLPAEFSSDSDRLKRFQMEARAASVLSHPNIVTIYDVGTEGAISYIAMELVEGKTLHSVLEAGPLPLRKAIQIASQIADALARAHESGIIHRDLKPENIVITREGFPKVLDFGLAKSVPGSRRPQPTRPITQQGMLLGTAGYMSPEQAGGQELDWRSDQFSFGAVFYEMLTGTSAFLRNSTTETMTAILAEEPPLPESTPPPVKWIVQRCLAKNREERYASTRDLALELHRVLDHFSELDVSRSKPAPSGAALRKGAGLAGIAAAALLAGLLLPSPFRGPAAPATPQVRPLTFSGKDSAPSVAPDGRTVAYASERDGKSRIWLQNLKSGDEAALTEGPDYFPRFSPDGSSLLFVRYEDGNGTLYRSSVLGGEPRKIATGAYMADWSPEGKRIVFVRIEPQGDQLFSSLRLIDSDGGNESEILHKEDLMFLNPRWSPDGRRIVVLETPSAANNALLLLDVASRKERHLLPPEQLGNLGSADWLDPARVVYMQYERIATFLNPPARFLLQDVDSGKCTTVLWANNAAGNIEAEEGKLVFDVSQLRQNLREIDTANPAAGHWLTQGYSGDRQPVYSRDGAWVIFSSNRGENLDLWKLNRHTGAMVRITEDDANDWDPAFSPDGRSIAWSSNRSGVFEIWMADAGGANARQISRDGVDAENPTFTPDGKWVIYNSYNPEKRGIWKVRSDGTEGSRVLAAESHVPEISPDGNYVVFTRSSMMAGTSLAIPTFYPGRSQRSGISVVRLSDGEVLPFQVSTAPNVNPYLLARARWSSDGKHVLFVEANELGGSGLYQQEFRADQDTSSTRRAVLSFDSVLIPESFAVSPDGLHVIVSSQEMINSLMLAENVPGIGMTGK